MASSVYFSPAVPKVGQTVEIIFLENSKEYDVVEAQVRWRRSYLTEHGEHTSVIGITTQPRDGLEPMLLPYFPEVYWWSASKGWHCDVVGTGRGSRPVEIRFDYQYDRGSVPIREESVRV